jgi:hypothetical protein
VLELTGYADADRGNYTNDQKSISGYVTLSWNCKKQPSVALSTAEAKNMATSKAAQEGMWIRDLLTECGFSVKPMLIKQDNTGGIAMTKNPVNQGRTNT